MSYTGQNPRFRSTILTDIGLGSIGNPASGSHRIINRGGTLQVQDDTGLETAIGAGGTVDRITQVGHGFVEGEILYNTGSAYAKANANTSATAEALGMVSRVIDVDTFELTLEGKVTGLTGLTAGAVYFLSASTAGAITVTEPSTLGYVSLPIGVAISTTAFYVKSSRGAVVGSTNARTEIALANNATTNVQSVAAYQAGELTGWVEIDGTTDSKFYVSAPFAKNGAATDYNISPQYVGDTPPVGFSITVTSGGLIQATLPSITGYVSAKINFALNAPAVGATFPLSIDSTLVQFSTLKAKDSGGFVFQENGGTQIGSWNDTGGLTAGIANTDSSHQFHGVMQLSGKANGDAIFNLNATGAGDSAEIGFLQGGVNKWAIGRTPGESPGNFAWYNYTLGAIAGSINEITGAWTLAGTNTFHEIKGNSTNSSILRVRNYEATTASDNDSPLAIIKGSTTTGSGQYFIDFAISGGGAGHGRIVGSGTDSAAFALFSDRKLKENIAPLEGQLDAILALKPCTYDLKAGGNGLGFIAQELQEVFPDSVTLDEKEDLLQICGWDRTSARLVAAIQELSAKVTALENKGI